MQGKLNLITSQMIISEFHCGLVIMTSQSHSTLSYKQFDFKPLIFTLKKKKKVSMYLFKRSLKIIALEPSNIRISIYFTCLVLEIMKEMQCPLRVIQMSLLCFIPCSQCISSNQAGGKLEVLKLSHLSRVHLDRSQIKHLP